MNGRPAARAGAAGEGRRRGSAANPNSPARPAALIHKHFHLLRGAGAWARGPALGKVNSARRLGLRGSAGQPFCGHGSGAEAQAGDPATGRPRLPGAALWPPTCWHPPAARRRAGEGYAPTPADGATPAAARVHPRVSQPSSVDPGGEVALRVPAASSRACGGRSRTARAWAGCPFPAGPLPRPCLWAGTSIFGGDQATA